jgi:predicted nucleic acid-binding protein
VCKRKFKYTKGQSLSLWSDLLDDCIFVSTNKSTFEKAALLTKRYDFQLFDAIIIASALEMKCDILYSEDMQHEMLVESKLIIINPFIS